VIILFYIFAIFNYKAYVNYLRGEKMKKAKQIFVFVIAAAVMETESRKGYPERFRFETGVTPVMG
jgi:hypothetical protein